jgi:hypothetical protein
MGGNNGFIDTKATFSKEEWFGFKPDKLNLFGTNKDRAAFTLPGNTGKKDAREAEESIQASNAKAIADAKAAQELAGSQAMASVTNKKRAIARSQSVYTSPLGVAGQANLAKKTLLGA